MIVSVNFTADHVVGKFALTAIEHDGAGGPGCGVFLLDILDTYKYNDAEDFIGVLYFCADGHGVRRAAAPVDFLWGIFQADETRARA